MTEENTNQEIANNALVTFINQKNVDVELRDNLIKSFQNFYDQVEEWKKKAEGIKITSIDQVREMQIARNARLAFKDLRINVDKVRKELKDEYLRKCQIIDGIAKIITDSITPIEDYLKEQEKFAEIQAQKIKDELKAKRILELAAFEVNCEFYDLANMPEDIYQELLLNSEKKFIETKEAEEKAIRDAQEKERLDKLEQERKIEIAPYRQFIEIEPDLRNMEPEDYTQLLQLAAEAKNLAELEQEEIKKENERLKQEREEQEKKHQDEQEKIRKENESKMQEERKSIREEERIRAEQMADQTRAEAGKKPPTKKAEAEPENVDKETGEIFEDEPKEEINITGNSDKEKCDSAVKELMKFQLRLPEMETTGGQRLMDDVGILLNKIIAHINKQKEIL